MATEPQAEPTEPLHPLALIQQAIAKGVDADYMGKLMDLQERYDRNLGVKAFAVALNDCQAEMPNVVKDSVNPHLKTRYASLEHMNAITKPIYTKHGFSISFGEEDCPRENTLRMGADVRHADGHCQHYHIDVPLDGTGVKGNANMTGTQGKGSTISYARRYLLKMIFNVAESDEDNDGNEVAPTVTEAQAQGLEALIKSGYNDGGLKFLDWMEKAIGVKSVTKIPADKYKMVHDILTKAQPKKAAAKAAEHPKGDSYEGQ